MTIRLCSIAIALLFLVMLTPVARAETTDLSTMLSRMQSIIAEMEALQQEFKALVSVVDATKPSGQVLGASTSNEPVFTESLEYGETNDDIARIQRLLATDPEIYPYGVDSGFFGPKTQEAIRSLQKRFGLDPVGVIGPATTDLLSGYMRAYPNENYPEGVLSTKPQVLGASTSNTSSSDQLSTLQQQLALLTSGNANITSDSGNPASKIEVEFKDGNARINVFYKNGDRNILGTDDEDEDDIVAFIADETDLSESQVEAVIDFLNEPENGDKEEADDALNDADDAIDDAQDEIDEADDDGEDVEWAEDTLDKANDSYDDADEAFDAGDYDEAIELAEEAKDFARYAIRRIGREREIDAGDIDEIIARIGDGKTKVEVQYEDGDDEKFTVTDEDEDDIIRLVADRLGIDKDDIEDLFEFKDESKELDEILAWIDEEDDETKVEIFFENGVISRFTLDTTDEDEIIEEIADRYNLDEDDVDDAIEFVEV